VNEPGTRILVVDDNATNLKLMTLLLARSTYDVRTAANAYEAQALVQSFKPRLILLDLQLPDIDGLELTRRWKSDPVTRDTTIVAVTAYAMTGDEERARAAGADGYITKPLDRDRFRQAVAGYLAR
jgi:two-component system, cell cycle response regulator DivK